MLPDKCQIYIAALEDEVYKGRKIGFWENVYGVNMRCMSTAIMKDAVIDHISNC